MWTMELLRRRLTGSARGQMTIVVALVLVVLVGMAGLAIDSGRAYGVKAKLNAAVDAASLAGARALAEGDDDAARIAHASATAERFFAANYPNGFLGSEPGPIQTIAEHDAAGFWRVTVNGSAVMPVTLLRVLLPAPGPVTVVASSQALRRDVDVMLVLDTSGSLGPPTSPHDTLAKLKVAAINGFVAHFSAAPGGDRVGLVAFASGAVLSVPIDKTAHRGFVRTNGGHTGVVDQVQALTISGSTAQAEGLRRGLDEINQVPQHLRSSLRVILLFSDGAPNGVSGTFTRSSGGGGGGGGGTAEVVGSLYSETDGPGNARATRLFRADRRDSAHGTYDDIASLPATGLGNVALAGARGLGAGPPYGNTRCNVNKAARNMVENVANQARNQGIMVYTVGLGARLNSLEVTFCGYGNAERGANILRRVANDRSADTHDPSDPIGRYCYAADADELKACFSEIASEVLRLTM